MCTFNINPSILIFLDLKFMLLSVISKQISNFFHVNFNETASNQIFLLILI